ncbi:hypothetical protein HNQ35_002005 [Cerasibacillus quisquiliarum]|uniref:Uncharacterized protein n=1 Tax=Cerasibacillus quisquiliarum TaxID=227865 RepID=A0A511UY83_9BACI|nr:hypothetical protein [Cerasibacillus quisquiliarum]GEN31594.1 hypothetical protein CQU01_18320 [Cerasibacillus quisquiliarum]
MHLEGKKSSKYMLATGIKFFRISMDRMKDDYLIIKNIVMLFIIRKSIRIY